MAVRALTYLAVRQAGLLGAVGLVVWAVLFTLAAGGHFLAGVPAAFLVTPEARPLLVVVLPETLALAVPAALGLGTLAVLDSGEAEAGASVGVGRSALVLARLAPALVVVLLAVPLVAEVRPAALRAWMDTLHDTGARGAIAWQHALAGPDVAAAKVDGGWHVLARVAGGALAVGLEAPPEPAEAGLRTGAGEVQWLAAGRQEPRRWTFEQCTVSVPGGRRAVAALSEQELSSPVLARGATPWVRARGGAAAPRLVAGELARRRARPWCLLAGGVLALGPLLRRRGGGAPNAATVHLTATVPALLVSVLGPRVLEALVS